MAGPAGLTILHLAALLDDGGKVADELTGRFPFTFAAVLMQMDLPSCSAVVQLYFSSFMWLRGACSAMKCMGMAQVSCELC